METKRDQILRMAAALGIVRPQDLQSAGIAPAYLQRECCMNNSAEEFNARQERLKARQDAQAYEFMYLLRLAAKATSSEGDAAGKWKANAELMTWFRANPVRVIEALQAGNEWARRPGGMTTQRFIRALKKVQGCECKEEVA